MRFAKLTGVLALAAICSSGLSAQAVKQPNFTGTWVLDPTKSIVNGQIAVPTSATAVILQRGDTITQDREGTSPETGVVKSHTVWGLDGKAWKNTLPINGEPTAIESVLSWDGMTLVVKSTLTVMEMPVEDIGRWTMSADGKSIVMSRSIVVAGSEYGSSTTTYVKKN